MGRPPVEYLAPPGLGNRRARTRPTSRSTRRWEQSCPSCSFLSDHIDGSVVHLAARDVRLVVVSRAPIAQIEAFKKRMGWRFKWVSSYGNDFNRDYQVSFTKDEMA